jgi:hypothetical protein
VGRRIVRREEKVRDRILPGSGEPALQELWREHEVHHSAVLRDEAKARRRRARIERHVDGARAQRAQHRRHGASRSRQVNADAVSGAEAARLQGVGEAVRHRLELAVLRIR